MLSCRDPFTHRDSSAGPNGYGGSDRHADADSHA
jgi:hypothetical protein